MSENVILQTRGLTVGYQSRREKTPILKNLDLSLKAGQLVCLLGPNGAGKSTLMRTLAGMQPALTGGVTLGGADLGSLRPQDLARTLSVVTTERIDAGLLSAYALVALGRYPYTGWHGSLSHQDEAIIQQAMRDVGAVPLAHRPVSELSDGERQKVMIARALAQEPKLMLLDEPTAFLDLPRRVEILQILRQLAHDGGRAILLSTHDLDLALRSADVVWLVADSGIHVGTPEELVLSGAFAAAFASEGVAFDPMTGSFKINQTLRGDIDVIAEELTAIWTARALERIGYKPHLGRNGADMNVTFDGGEWQLQTSAEVRRFKKLAELEEALGAIDA